MPDSVSDPSRKTTSHHILISVNFKDWAQEQLDLQALSTRLFIIVTKPYKAIFEVSIVFTSNDEIHMLNATYRHKDQPTNVLSFPSGLFHPEKQQQIPIIPLGDVVLAYETVKRESAEQGIPFSDHLTHLLIHGFLHLLGYDHELEDEAEIMEALEIQHLKALGINNPYLVRE